MKIAIPSTLGALVLGLLWTASATAAADAGGKVDYRIGGVGRESASEMKAARDQYPLAMTFAESIDGKAAYTTDVAVRIRNSNDDELVETKADGPLMLVDLPAGRYRISAERDGKPIEREVEIASGERRQMLFEFPSDETSHSIRPNDMTTRLPKPVD